MSEIKTEWMDGTGVIVERTNTVIVGLLDWADKSDVNAIKRVNVEDAIKSLTPVNGDDTVDKYVRRVIDHGPFEAGGAALWYIEWDRVYRAQEDTNGEDA